MPKNLTTKKQHSKPKPKFVYRDIKLSNLTSKRLHLQEIKLMKSSEHKTNPVFYSGTQIEKNIKTHRDLMLFYLKMSFYRNFQIWDDLRSFPQADIFGKDYEWWKYCETDLKTFKIEDLKELDIPQQISNIKEYTAIIRNKWNGQKDIIIGCGHTHTHDCGSYNPRHVGEYTVDPNPSIGSDCLLEVGSFSLSRIIPEAIGKIESIHVEGVIINDNECFQNDLLKLLKDGGVVTTIHGKVIEKIDGKLYKTTECKYHSHRTPHKPWTVEVNKTTIHVKDLGSDSFDWTSHIKKVKMYHETGISKKSVGAKTPFDPTFCL